jgi:hypothetical protein
MQLFVALMSPLARGVFFDEKSGLGADGASGDTAR